jgi:hypothetical protein
MGFNLAFKRLRKAHPGLKRDKTTSNASATQQVDEAVTSRLAFRKCLVKLGARLLTGSVCGIPQYPD